MQNRPAAAILSVNMATNIAHDKNKTLLESQKKWGKEAIASGFTLFPSILLSKQHALGLDCIDVVLILQIAKHWWHAENLPFPSQLQLAKTMAVDPSTVKRHLARLKELGFITWTERRLKDGGQAANAYDLSGLIQHVHKYAVEELEARARAKDERKERQRRKKPKLRLVRSKEGADE